MVIPIKLSKLLNDVSTYVDEIGATMAIIPLPPPVRSGLMLTLDSINTTVNAIRDELDNDNTEVIIGRHDIKLDEFELLPASKQIVINGQSYKLAPAEFNVLYRLASNAGQAVTFKADHSHMTRMSNIRRTLPSVKPMIETLGGGKYILHTKTKF